MFSLGGNAVVFSFFLTYSGFCFSFLFLLWRDHKIGGGGDGQNLGEVEAGDKHAQNILYKKNVNKKRWVCKLKQVVVLIQCSSGKFYKSDVFV